MQHIYIYINPFMYGHKKDCWNTDRCKEKFHSSFYSIVNLNWNKLKNVQCYIFIYLIYIWKNRFFANSLRKFAFNLKFSSFNISKLLICLFQSLFKN